MESIAERVFEQTQEYGKELKRIISELETKNEIYEKALDDALVFYTVDEFSSFYGKHWSEEEKREVDKEMEIYCLSNAIQIREYEITSKFLVKKTYPLTAWKYLYLE